MSKLKDTEKGYDLTNNCVKVFNRVGRLLLYAPVKQIYYSNLIGDYDIILRGGGEISIDPGIIKDIVDREIRERSKKNG